MLEKFPYGCTYTKKDKLSIEEIGFHTIKFKCDAYLPFLPYRDNKLMFSNGVMIGTYWYEEILNAIKNRKCEIINHYSSITYEKEDYLFKEYVMEFMKIRDRNTYYNIFGKNMINGLYGSFALNDENEMYILTMSEDEFLFYQKEIDIISFKKIGDIYILKVIKNIKSKKYLDKKNKWDMKNKKRNIAYAAIIASKARIKLNNSLQSVLDDGGRIYYTDTDSIFAGYKNNKKKKKIGDIEWSETYEDAVFISSKFYYLKDKNIKLKGVNKNEHTFEEIKEDFYNNNKIIEFVNQFSILKSNYELFELYNNKKININSYDKRIFTNDKKETKPIYLNTDYNV
jgi:hypothetical protein